MNDKPMPEFTQTDVNTALAQEEIAHILYEEGAWCGDCDYGHNGWEDCDDCKHTCHTIAEAVLKSPFVTTLREKAGI